MKKLALFLFVSVLPLLAQAPDPRVPVLRPGVSVKMATSTNAAVLREADDLDALVLAMTAQGKTYLDITPTPVSELSAAVKKALSGKPAKRLYLKFDARIAFEALSPVFAALRTAGLDSVYLLTDQRDTGEAEFPRPPKGFRVFLMTVSVALPMALESHDGALRMKLMGDELGLESLAARLPVSVSLLPGPTVTFQDLVRVIDVCQSKKVRVEIVR